MVDTMQCVCIKINVNNVKVTMKTQKMFKPEFRDMHSAELRSLRNVLTLKRRDFYETLKKPWP
jgi:hypothetical protein